MQSKSHLETLGRLIDGMNLTDMEPASILWKKIKEDNGRLFEELAKPLEELCAYTNGSDADIDQLITDGLDLVHRQLVKLIEAVKDDLLPDEDSMLISGTVQDQIRWYIRLVFIIFLVLIVVSGSIPVLFFALVTLVHCCRARESNASGQDAGNATFDSFPADRTPSRQVLCCSRVFVTPFILIVFIVIGISVLLYAVDLLDQGICRTVHDDQGFVVSFLIGNFVRSAAERRVELSLRPPR